MKYSELEIAGMLQDNNDTINELKEKIKELENKLVAIERIARINASYR